VRSAVCIVGLVDVSSAAAGKTADRHGLDVPTFQSLEAALAALDVDVVLDTALPETRRQVAGTGLEAGCHVLSEKPFATSVGDAQALLKLANESGRTHAVMQNRRYLPGTQGMRQLIADGVIGDVGLVCADFFLGAHFGGFRDEMENVLLLDMAIHTFDQARFMMGMDATTAYCDEFNLPGSWYRGNASALAVFEMRARNGGAPARYCYRGSWSAEGAATPWEAEWRICGSRGTAIWNGVDAPYAEVGEGDGFLRKAKRIETSVDWRGPDGHAGCLGEMVSALAAGEKPMTHSGDNAKSLGMVLAAIESAERGEKVPVRL
jgi:predicted dehydrogenase